MRQLLGFGVAPTSKNQNPKELPLAWADPSPFIGHTLSFITSGVDRVAAVTCEGKVFLWGRFYDAENEEESEKFTEIPSPTLFHFSANVIVTQIALGESFTVALSDNGHVFSWGCGYHGQLGHGDVRDSHEPRQIHSLNGKNVVQIVCGKTHSMARTDSGDVFTWGYGQHGQLGHGSEEYEFIPKFVKKLLGSKVIWIAAGQSHSLAISDDGAAYTWGDNACGQLGNGTHKSVRYPIRMDTPADVTITRASAGFQYTLVLDSHGRVYSCGLNTNGQLGIGHRKAQSSLQLVKTLMHANILAIYAGFNSAAAISDTQQLYTWGKGTHNRLGHGFGHDFLEPALVNILKYDQAASVCMGGNFSYVVIDLPSFD
eukprot:TRINITY_DN2423_c0_g2_i3.p1 TRINITY_DN2423_c0_g2~~TRINITY_DN2423_c0_g2_i3.p1  ORF type:complete len:371 (+),score=65.24 TRINITY_DN2423_c0_g2_i3:87-1199(+)